MLPDRPAAPALQAPLELARQVNEASRVRLALRTALLVKLALPALEYKVTRASQARRDRRARPAVWDPQAGLLVPRAT